MAMSKLTNNFSLREFRCKDGTDVPEEYMDNVKELAENLQVLREHLGKAIRVISGYRSSKYNRKIDGARRSQHLTASAADVKISGMTPKEIRDVIEQLIKDGLMKQGGIGVYTSFLHYDVRNRKVRWFGKGVKDDREGRFYK
tara:strand:- start:7469 stop:7894 length:426 start_codon:yes stop_codon:yes gene_type:complete